LSRRLSLLDKAGALEREKRGTFAYLRLKLGALERTVRIFADEPFATA